MAECALRHLEGDGTIAVINRGSSPLASREQIKLVTTEAYTIEAGTGLARSLKWSKVPITFDHRDWTGPNNSKGHLPLVVSPTICNVWVTRALVDSGANINLLFPAAFAKMQVLKANLQPTPSFHGVLPGQSQPLIMSICPSPLAQRTTSASKLLLLTWRTSTSPTTLSLAVPPSFWRSRITRILRSKFRALRESSQ
jgi:hypothetical protein